MDKTKAIEICKQWVKLFGEISYDFVSDEDEATYKERGEALQTLIAHAEKAPVKWFNEQATQEAFILDLMFATGCRTENIIANNQMRKRIKDVLTAYQEAAKGEKNG